MRTGEQRVGELLKVLDQVFSAAIASACRGLPEDQAEDIARAWTVMKREMVKELRASRRRHCQMRKLSRFILTIAEEDRTLDGDARFDPAHQYAIKLARSILETDERKVRAKKNRVNLQVRWGGTGAPIPKAHARRLAHHARRQPR